MKKKLLSIAGILLLFPVLLLLNSCHKETFGISPIEFGNVNIEFQDFELQGKILEKVECVKQGERGREFSYQRLNEDVAGHLVYKFGMTDKDDRSFNGFGWWGDTEINLTIRDESGYRFKLKLYVTGKVVGLNVSPENAYCTPVLTKVEILEGLTDQYLKSNEWNVRLSSESLVKIWKDPQEF